MADPTPADEREALAVVDRDGDVWTPRADGLWETPETAPLPWEHVLRKYAPLRPARRSQPAPRTVSAAEVERATRTACVEAGWDWSGEPAAGIPSPEHEMRPVVLAALADLGIAVEAPRG